MPGSFVPDTDMYLGFIARAENQEASDGASLYVKTLKYTSLATLKSRCTNELLSKAG